MNSVAVLPSPAPSAFFRRARHVARAPLTVLLLASLLASAVALLAILAVTGMNLAFEFAKFLLLAASVGMLAVFCFWRRHPWYLTDTAAIVSIATIGLLLCGLVSCLGLRLGLPLADGLLARGDRLIGFDVGKVTDFVAGRPALSTLLYVAYGTSAPLCVAVVVWNLIRRDRLLVWQLVATIVVAMQITALVSILFPAQGAAVSLGLDVLQGNGLPVGAGTYSVAEFAFFYSGSDLLVTHADINGIVCFPSFHTVMALVIVQGFATSPLKWAAVIWGALTIISTVPMGGHWVTDLGGGILVWLVACHLATWACRFPARTANPKLPGQAWFARQVAVLRA